MQTIVLIPAYKPDKTMIDLVFALRQSDLRVLVVDDGSGGDYAAVFDTVRPAAHVLTLPQNGGKGAALKAGFAYLREQMQPPFTVVTADADGQHRLADILSVAEAAREHPGALVLGCRSIDRTMPLRNWFGNFYTKLAFLFATGGYLHDTQTGLRGFSDRLLPFLLSVKGNRYEYETNVLLYWMRCRLPLAEVPISTVYNNGNSTSHFHPLRDSAIIYSEILKFSAPSFCCLLADVLLFCLLFFNLPFGQLLLANTLARLVSAPLHFWLLRRQTASEAGLPRLSAGRYFAVAAGVLCLNTLLLWGLTSLQMPVIAAKIVADIALFFLTFIFQRRFFYPSR